MSKKMSVKEAWGEIYVAVSDAQGELFGWGGEENRKQIAKWDEALEIIEGALKDKIEKEKKKDER